MQISVWKSEEVKHFKNVYNGAVQLSREFIQIALLLLFTHMPFV
jgi:hypothetical protein